MQCLYHLEVSGKLKFGTNVNVSLNSASVAVIIPVSGSSNLFRKSLESVLNETDEVEEIIIILNGADSSLKRLIPVTQNKIQLIEIESALGASQARNIGASIAESQFLRFLDADDQLIRGSSQEMIKLIKKKESEVVFGKIRVNDIRTGSSRETATAVPAVGSTLLHRSIFEHLGGFDTSLKMGEFIDLFVRIRKNGFTERKLDSVVLERNLHDENYSNKNLKTESIHYLRILRNRLNSEK